MRNWNFILPTYMINIKPPRCYRFFYNREEWHTHARGLQEFRNNIVLTEFIININLICGDNSLSIFYSFFFSFMFLCPFFFLFRYFQRRWRWPKGSPDACSRWLTISWLGACRLYTRYLPAAAGDSIRADVFVSNHSRHRVSWNELVYQWLTIPNNFKPLTLYRYTSYQPVAAAAVHHVRPVSREMVTRSYMRISYTSRS